MRCSKVKRLGICSCGLIGGFHIELKRRTEENKERRAQERLDDYNRRNYKVTSGI